jgi:hypothetical protein
VNYTSITLFGLGLLGILLHNLVEMNKLNRLDGGKFSIRSYLRAERFSILISVIVILVAMIIKQEIQQLEAAGKWLGVAFVAIGYMGQSLLIFLMGRAGKVIDKPEE